MTTDPPTTVRDRLKEFQHFVREQDPSSRICFLFDKVWEFKVEHDYPDCPLTWEEIEELERLGFVHIDETKIHPRSFEPFRVIQIRNLK